MFEHEQKHPTFWEMLVLTLAGDQTRLVRSISLIVLFVTLGVTAVVEILKR